MGTSRGNSCVVGGIDPTDPHALDDWPNCSIPDCENKVCTWATATLCFPHSEELIGRDEMIRRYDATHERTWAEMRAEGVPGDWRTQEEVDVAEEGSR